MSSYCTLFDKNYLDKGLAMIDSFQRYNHRANMYVLAMDDICYDCFEKMNIKRVVPIRLSDFETEELLQAKANRSRGEYCWTCASNLVRYIFETYEEDCCTYIDADLYFYADPDILVNEMIEKGKSVQIIERRDFAGRFQQKISGRFCVQFNTFKNDKMGRSILEEWCAQTLEQCVFAYGIEKLGDQMYLDEWPEKYGDFVNILENPGAGVAPWNLNRYVYVKEDSEGIWIRYDSVETPIQLVFFHYHGMDYLDRENVDINVHKRFWKVDMTLALKLYEKYVQVVEEKKAWINSEFGFLPLVQGDALGIEDRRRFSERVKDLFKGNCYENIRIRIGNYMKIALFGKQDMIRLRQSEENC